MPRAWLKRLSVTGVNKPPAEIDFHPNLTFITGISNTGKSHVLKCVDFALGGSVPEHDFDEARGYDRVVLEIESVNDEGSVATYTVRRGFGDETEAGWFVGSASEWNDEEADFIPVQIDPKKPAETLSGRLLTICGFDSSMALVKSQQGKTQALSIRTVAPLFLISEEAVIAEESPVVPPSFGATAARSAFKVLLTGTAPSPDEIARLQAAHKAKEQAKQRVEVLDPIVATLRQEILEAGFKRADLETGLTEVDDALGSLSELVAASGDAVRGLISRRNRALSEAQAASRQVRRARELHDRFQLLAEHYDSDVQRLEFVLEGGHFFQQIEASHCPRCGRELEREEECHDETSEFRQIEKSCRAELKKLAPRIDDLKLAIADAAADAERGSALRSHWEERAKLVDDEIREVANPSAADARERVRTLAARRKEIESHLLRFRELDRYLAIKQEADLQSRASVDIYRPEQDAVALRSFQQHIKSVLESWHFPIESDVVYDLDADDIAIDGKARAANGKGVRAVTHAAFTVGLMRHCFAAKTPHPGFAIIDSPLTPYRGAAVDEAEDVGRRQDVHMATLRSLAGVTGQGQTVMIENIDPPVSLETSAATVISFSGPNGAGRRGFYPQSSRSRGTPEPEA